MHRIIANTKGAPYNDNGVMVDKTAIQQAHVTSLLQAVSRQTIFAKAKGPLATLYALLLCVDQKPLEISPYFCNHLLLQT